MEQTSESKSLESLTQQKQLPRVDIGFACYGMQPPNWWLPIMINLLAENGTTCEIGEIHASFAMLPDNNKNMIADGQKNRSAQTDEQRQKCIAGFRSGTAEWLMFIDDDTVPPKGAIGKLLALKRRLVSGLYFNASDKVDPVAYFRRPDGSYSSINTYCPGEVIEVDGIGMGCALIHRSVFDEIEAGHEVFITPKAELIAIPKDKIRDHMRNKNPKEFIANGVLHTPVWPKPEDDIRPFPFFALRQSRTEDLDFCELAANVGIKPYIDSRIICDHWKLKPINKKAYNEAREGLK